MQEQDDSGTLKQTNTLLLSVMGRYGENSHSYQRIRGSGLLSGQQPGHERTDWNEDISSKTDLFLLLSERIDLPITFQYCIFCISTFKMKLKSFKSI